MDLRFFNVRVNDFFPTVSVINNPKSSELFEVEYRVKMCGLSLFVPDEFKKYLLRDLIVFR